MFTNILFLFLLLLLTTFAPSTHSQTPLIYSLGLYVLLLAGITLQTRWLKIKPERKLLLVNCELLAYLAVDRLVLGSAQRWAPFDTPGLVISLLQYFGGLIYYYAAVNRPPRQAQGEVRLLIPFVLPFLLITIVFDFLNLYPDQEALAQYLASAQGTGLLLALSLIFILGLLLILPRGVQALWQCVPLPASPLKERLDALCQRAHFSHAGLKTWTVLNHAHTAAILGVVPRYRYVLFTQRLLKELPPESIEAVLAHEIGHSYRRHLLLFPLILMGLPLLLTLFMMGTAALMDGEVLQGVHTDSSEWGERLYPLALFIPCAILAALYFRFVFGFFSRLFERQADLHVFALEVPATHLVAALDQLGRLGGNIHAQPNWHHYSIQQRIDFLQAAMTNPALIIAHHKRVKRYLWAYSVLFAALFTIVLVY